MFILHWVEDTLGTQKEALLCLLRNISKNLDIFELCTSLLEQPEILQILGALEIQSPGDNQLEWKSLLIQIFEHVENEVLFFLLLNSVQAEEELCVFSSAGHPETRSGIQDLYFVRLHFERGSYRLLGEVRIAENSVGGGQRLFLNPLEEVSVLSGQKGHAVLFLLKEVWVMAIENGLSFEHPE